MASVLRKAWKLFRSLGHLRTIKALRFGAAPTFEHEALLTGMGPLATIVDVGANIGQFALLCKLVQPHAKIHSFEPMEAAAATFKKVFGDDSLVRLHGVALGDRVGSAEINVTAKADSSSLLSLSEQEKIFPQTRKVGTELIRVSRLSDEIAEDEIVSPALLKIDVQGFEGEVLKGCSGLLSRFDWIYCEMSFIELYQDQPLATELVLWLANRGFSIASVSVDPLMIKGGRAIQADFLFQRSAS